MIRGICDSPDRLAARLYVWLRVDCPCCTFFRAFALGLILGSALFGAAAALLLHLP
ncbi:MAG: hypothetical protein IT519_16695 [Burkholderiales bacterium]|nr:hypothetical protein [Burkholderiales bacterium]